MPHRYPYAPVRAKGLLTVNAYQGVGLDNNKGKLITTFTKQLDINDFDTGTCGADEFPCGFIREIRIPIDAQYTTGYNDPYIEVTFETQGQAFHATDHWVQ